MVEFRCGQYTADAVGIVDSGADGSLLPKSLAPELGLDPGVDLQPSPENSGGAGGIRFPTWTTSKTITGQIVAFLPAGRQLWGPIITFRPVFADGEHALFGRADFFQEFAIRFEAPNGNYPVFHLDH
jgi:hypothetical protein